MYMILLLLTIANKYNKVNIVVKLKVIGIF